MPAVPAFFCANSCKNVERGNEQLSNKELIFWNKMSYICRGYIV